MSTKPLLPEAIADIRELFFRRLAETNRDLIQAHIDAGLVTSQHDNRTALAILLEVENRVQAMRTMLTVFEECLED